MKKLRRARKIVPMLLAAALLVGGWALWGTGGEVAFADDHADHMKAVWMSTIYSSDYPATKNNEMAQKKEFTDKLDILQSAGINTVVVQVRPKSDALYQSDINPWSEVLTGVAGKDPGYDPMAFMISEAHKRGMSFHAWLNPYRITTSGTDLSALCQGHPAKLHPEWVISYKNALYYNPDLEAVKLYVRDTVKEIVAHYDVDGIHLDDYFYPSGYPLPPGESKNGFVANQRRANVDEMVKLVHDTIKESKPQVLFGISPMGIWKNNTTDPKGSATNGQEGYYAVYSDALSWIKAGTIDYLVPQIYWETGHKLADYETLVKWWEKQVAHSDVKLYIGQGIYRDPVAKEIDKQLAINETYKGVKGSFFFSTRDLINDRQGARGKITEFYKGELQMPETPKDPAIPVKVKGLATTSKVVVDGKNIAFEAYNIGGYNYFKIKDVAYVSSGTKKQFHPAYNETERSIYVQKGTPYVLSGGELAKGDGKDKTALSGTAKLLVDGAVAPVESYNINGHNYYRLKDLGKALDFSVFWAEDSKTVFIDMERSYQEQ